VWRSNWASPDPAEHFIDEQRKIMLFDPDISAGNRSQTYRDLGGSLSDTKWCIRFKTVVTTYNNGGDVDNVIFWIGPTDSTANSGTNQDGIGIRWNIDSGGVNNLQAVEADNEDINNANAINFAHTPTAETLYMEIVRLSGTEFRVSIFRDTGYTDLIETVYSAVATTVDGLRYFKMDFRIVGATSNNLEGYIDDLKVWNNQVNADGPCEGFNKIQILTRKMDSGNTDKWLRFNFDDFGTDLTDGNYFSRICINGGAEDTTTYDHRTKMIIWAGTSISEFSESVIPNNLEGEVTSIITHTITKGATGEASAPSRIEYVGKWERTEEVHTVHTVNTASGGLDTDTTITIFGEVPETIGGADNFDTIYEALT